MNELPEIFTFASLVQMGFSERLAEFYLRQQWRWCSIANAKSQPTDDEKVRYLAARLFAVDSGISDLNDAVNVLAASDPQVRNHYRVLAIEGLRS